MLQDEDYAALELRVIANTEAMRQGLRAEHDSLSQKWVDGKATNYQMIRCAILDDASLNNYEDLL